MMQIGFIIFLACFILSRILSEQALSLISIEEKVKLLETFAKVRTYNLVPFTALLLSYFITDRFFPSVTGVIIIVLLLPLLGYSIVTHRFFFRTLKELRMRESYVQKMFQSRIASYGGYGSLLVFTVLSFLQE